MLRRILLRLPVWAGLYYLSVYGDLRSSENLTGFNPQVWWSAWFLIAAAVSAVAFFTNNRRAQNVEFGCIFVIGAFRSIVYVANGLMGPLGVWLILIGYAWQAWKASGPSPQSKLCDRADQCLAAVDVRTKRLKRSSGLAQAGVVASTSAAAAVGVAGVRLVADNTTPAPQTAGEWVITFGVFAPVVATVVYFLNREDKKEAAAAVQRAQEVKDLKDEIKDLKEDVRARDAELDEVRDELSTERAENARLTALLQWRDGGP